VEQPPPRPRRREEHELEFSRIVAFSDGVFAIAITLLVLQINVPSHISSDSDLAHQITHQHGDLIAYAVSFAVIGRFWVIHHRFFGDIAGFDGRLMGLNLLYLALIVLIPYSSQILGEFGDHSPSIVLYASNLALVTLVGSAMSAYALRAGLNAPGRADEIVANRNGGLYAAAVFLISIPVALVVPQAGPFVWLALIVDPTDRLTGRGPSTAD
jgi:uncharacterized membrane protein